LIIKKYLNKNLIIKIEIEYLKEDFRNCYKRF